MEEKPPREYRWSDRELYDLAVALQKYGSADVKRISEYIKTRSVNAVKNYLHAQKKIVRNKLSNEGNALTAEQKRRWKLNSNNDTRHWSNARKWQKIAKNQMMDRIASNDYSRLLMRNLCERFHEEAEEATTSQEIDIKAMYTFMLQCIRGQNPGELPPVESALILQLMGQLRNMRNELDFRQEVKYMRKYKKATRFIPIKVKDESKKDKKTEEIDPNDVPIPEEIYTNLCRHRRVIQSFNPLGIPMWLLIREQRDFT